MLRSGQFAKLSKRAMWLACLVILCAGCGSHENLDTQYGVRRGREGRTSIYGTAALAGLFREAGWSVRSVARLTPRLETCDTIIWLPQSTAIPGPQAIEFLENWLVAGEDRTLIVVGRGWDGESEYWRWAAEATQGEQSVILRRQLAQSLSEHLERRLRQAQTESCAWFTYEREHLVGRRATSLRGPWAKHIDVAETKLVTGDDFRVPGERPSRTVTQDPPSAELENDEDFDEATDEFAKQLFGDQSEDQGDEVVTYLDHVVTPLLESGDGTAWITRLQPQHLDDRQILIVNNGCFLLNLGLVPDGHRILARHVVQACGQPRRVAFLETFDADIRPLSLEAPRSAWDFFFLWPLNVPLLHLLVVGVLACAAMYPIFGRPKPAPKTTLSDFGHHVEALGDLLQASEDDVFARSRVEEYLVRSNNEAASARN